MTKKEYWEAHVKKNPKFADESNTIQMSVGMLRKLMEEAYDKGFDHHKAVSDAFKEALGNLGGKNPFENFKVKQ